MTNFWDYNVWGVFNLFAVLLLSLLVGNILQKNIPFLRNSLVPTSVIGGVLLIGVAAIYKAVTGDVMFDTPFFGGDGTELLEIITYHALALGFIASTLKTSESKRGKERTGEIFNTGVTTVATYILQGFIGLAVTLIAALIIPEFFSAAGALLPFGYGQGTGQALNYGTIYETDYGFDGGKSFGLTLAALGFLSASIGGVVYLNFMKLRGRLKLADQPNCSVKVDPPPSREDLSVKESMDNMTLQIALVAFIYFLTYALMAVLGKILPDSLRSIIYGFNFLLGVVVTILLKGVLGFFKKKDVIKREVTNNFLLTRVSNFLFDLMIVSGIAAIRLDILEKYWGIMLILGAAGTVFTYIYNRVIAKLLFPKYAEEQFLMMYGMLTGTASTGIILLREVDGEFRTPAADNMVYQNLPAIVFGFPMMIVASLAPKDPLLTLLVLPPYFILLNLILFRKQIFHRKRKTNGTQETAAEEATEDPAETDGNAPET